jgi:hypothetical protein
VLHLQTVGTVLLFMVCFIRSNRQLISGMRFVLRWNLLARWRMLLQRQLLALALPLLAPLVCPDIHFFFRAHLWRNKCGRKIRSFLLVLSRILPIWSNWMLLAVAVDADGSPASVSWSGDTRRNIIVWMDHRAVNQAERINASNSPVLQYCGGGVSPEMQAPKVLLVFWHAYGSNCLYVRFWPGSS